MYFNNNWCNNYVVKEKYCCEEIVLPTVGLRPFYLPLEFGQLFITVVYIHPKANNSKAIETLSDMIQNINTSNPDAVQLIMGDFNQCEFRYPNFEQYIDKCTRGNAILDKCFANVKCTFKVKLYSPRKFRSQYHVLTTAL